MKYNLFNENTRNMRRIILSTILTLLSIFAFAQQQYSEYLNEAKKLLSEGRVELAEKSYNVWKEMTKDTDLNFEKELKKEKNKIQYAPLLQKANQYYSEGKYVEAKESLAEYTKHTGVSDINLLTKITECITLSQEAKLALERNNLHTAKEFYNRLIEKNPTDVQSANAIAEINARTQKVKVVYDTPKKSLRPLKDKFNMFVYSGFTNPTGFGGGVGYNFSYFNLTIDGGGSVNQDLEGIREGMLSTDKVENCVKLDDGTYVQGNMQLAVTPGLNLKYFIVGVGLGTMMTKELSNPKESVGYYHGTQTKGSHFLIRPTVTGYIPFDKDFSGGLSVMAGYNIVNGVSGLNQFILGIGLFF